ncbi:hypothetical protein CDD82_3891 [Ophiocordyceps australis]|uniref:C2 domain-containing protein n=1 Tax=Ophiocordyceps australis TaxID=1399860 RepID=A0A2C5ZB91_9HYPO|nr:hypothetical protein CDD82_3891 [Ophiocordyceps australis]
MTTKTKTFALNGSHTAGIFADMSVDGPPIGTLVTIVDRAKNLPNRKTIGKQDPYCAARLGKEAKKTATDIRGGQTPKWDQELRFTVHDCPDYYQLKISVFTDDKKTDLIGEAWIDLKAIIVAGGGQNDMWQTLTCKGKYAGEIRLEITFYDTRPKPDKPPALHAHSTLSLSDKETGSLKQKTPMRRRPLPSDPITSGTLSSSPSAPLSSSHSAPDLLHHTPPRSHPFVPLHSPLQAVEYNTPSPHSPRQHGDYHPSPQSGHSTARVDGPRPERPRESKDATSRQFEESGYSQKIPMSPSEYADASRHHSQPPDGHVEMPAGEDPRQSVSMEDMRPPPPPVHRSLQESPGHKTPQSSSPMRHDVLKQEAHRHSSPSYPGRPTFRAYDSAPSAPIHSSPPGHQGHEQAHPRYHSYDVSGGPHHPRSMQATVEDAPESPPTYLGNSTRQGGPRIKGHDDMIADESMHPMPIDAGIPLRESPKHMDQAPRFPSISQQEHYEHLGSRCQSFPLEQSRVAYQTYVPPRERLELQYEMVPGAQHHVPNHVMPEVPASLSPGMDPALSREISEHIYDEELYERQHGASFMTMTRGRRMIEAPPSTGTYTLSNSPLQSHGGQRSSEVTYSGAPTEEMLRQASPIPSPSPQHAIRRKSVSPSPTPPRNRKSSDIPFGPDSYDALNPTLGSSRDPSPANNERVLHDGKIITHDGKEIDPSDHLPMESWAPEPERRRGQVQTSPETRWRPSPGGAQPMAARGRRPLRVARPLSTTTPQTYDFGDMSQALQAPATTNRNRLQKRGNRSSMGGYATMSSPLAPVSTDKLQGRQVMHMPARASLIGSPWDYGNENHVSHAGYGPVIPAKGPLPLMSGANGMVDYGLMEEMQRIDIGTGRSRRRGGGILRTR